MRVPKWFWIIERDSSNIRLYSRKFSIFQLLIKPASVLSCPLSMSQKQPSTWPPVDCCGSSAEYLLRVQVLYSIRAMFSGGFRGFGGFGGGMDEEESPQQQKEEVNTTKYYELLGVDKKATTEEIRKAFRKKALKEHPDKGGDPDKFKEVTAAYEVLSNPEKRQLYDDYGEEGVKNGGPPGGSGFGGLFDFFGGGGGKKQSGPRKGKAKLIELDVTLEEVNNGAMKTVKISRDRICEPCEGKGGKNVTKCTKCKGQGVVMKMVQLGPGMYSQSQARCADCGGLGETMKEEDRCPNCKGKKVLKVDRVLEVAIETGCPNEHDYIFTGEHDEYPGIIAGDVYVRIKIKKHETFQRRGADLVIVKKITLLEALTGVTMEIKHLDGKKHIIATAPGEVLNHQELKTVKGLGLPFYKDAMSHGHLYIEFLITYPKKGSIPPANLEKIAKILGGKPVKTDGYSKTPKNKILEDLHDSDLNANPKGGDNRHYEEDEMGGRSGAQQVRCQQQ